MRGVDERRLRVDVGGLDLDAPAAVAQPLGEPVRRPPLGVGAGQPALERAQLADHVHAAGGVHGRGIIAARVDSALRSDACGGWDSNPQALAGSGF